MSRRLYTFPLFLPNCRSRSFSLGSRYPPRFVSARVRSIFSVRAGQLPVVSLYRRRNEAIRRNENGARQRAARLRGTSNPPRFALAEAPREYAPRCIQTMFVPFGSRALPLSWAPFVYSRPLFRHPSRRSNNTLDSSFSRSLSLSLRSCHRFSLSLARAFLRSLLRRTTTLFQLPRSLLFSFPASACSFSARNGSPCAYTMASATISRYRRRGGNVEYSAGISRSPCRSPFFLLLLGLDLGYHPPEIAERLVVMP